MIWKKICIVRSYFFFLPTFNVKGEGKVLTLSKKPGVPGLVGVPVGLVDGGALAGGDGGRGPVGLAGRSVEGHHPVVRVLLVFSCKEHTVPFSHCVEEKLSAFQIYKEKI